MGIIHHSPNCGVVSRCNYCSQLMGTESARLIHHAGSEAFPKCRSKRRMKELGMWQGFKGIWWTTDLGWDNDPDILDRGSQPLDFVSAIVPQNAKLTLCKRGGVFGDVAQRQNDATESAA